MRNMIAFAVLLVAGCVDPAPTNVAATGPNSVGNEVAALQGVGDGAAPVVFNTQLSAENEPGPVSTSESKGHAQVKVLADGTMEFTFTINNKSDESFRRAHIHKAAAGANGPIHWDFLEAGQPVASVDGQPATLSGVARARAAAVLADLLANPHLYYVNVHSVAFPGGAVRGQLR
jgi:hypothetical protein